MQWSYKWLVLQLVALPQRGERAGAVLGWDSRVYLAINSLRGAAEWKMGISGMAVSRGQTPLAILSIPSPSTLHPPLSTHSVLHPYFISLKSALCPTLKPEIFPVPLTLVWPLLSVGQSWLSGSRVGYQVSLVRGLLD